MNMSNKTKAMVMRINKSCDALEFAEARRLIEFNISLLSNATYYQLLNTNAKVLFKHVVNENHSNNSEKGLSRLELLKIQNINHYCSSFDISMLKRSLKDSMELIQRPNVFNLLNSDAKIVLKSMGALLDIGHSQNGTLIQENLAVRA